MAKCTHKGVLRRVAARTSDNSRFITDLRETKNFWVIPGGTKYRKKDGCPAGYEWPMYYLDFSTIVPLRDCEDKS
jgi:hypothetical protein